MWFTNTAQSPNRRAVSVVFAIGFVAAAVCCALATGLALYGPANPAGDGVLLLVAVAAVLIAVLSLMSGARLIRVLSRPSVGAPAPRLHLRFVGLFAFAAVTPAVLMAVFFGVLLSRGLETWFGEQVEAAVQSAGATAQFYLDQVEGQTQLDAAAAAVDLSQPEVRAVFEQGQQEFEEVLESFAEFRAFKAAYVIVPSGQIVARYETGSPPPYRAPTPAELTSSRTQPLVEVDPEAEVLRVLAPLQDYPIEAYFYGVPDLNVELFDALRVTANAIGDFDDASAQRARIQRFFFIIYGEAALLILAGSIWLALSAAGRVTAPVGRLIVAADRVGAGDLSARVDPGDDRDEVAVLGRTFNLMTDQLERQRGELIEANDESESRRRLIEAVLSGVSAGVLSVDGEGIVRLANRSAQELLGAEAERRDAPLHEISPSLAEIADQARGRGGDIVERQIELMRDGSELALNVRAACDPLTGRVVLTFDDITRLIAAQRNAAWRDVARRIAHEIKNPLTPIQLSAERLRRRYRPDSDEDAGVFDRCTDTIIRQVGDIGRMVDEFSAFARMPTPHIEPAELGDLAQEAVFARRVADPEIEIAYEEPEDGVPVLCDARLASQAIANILKNATEAIATRMERDGEGAAPGRIQVSIFRRDHEGVIAVTDNGAGWPAGGRERLTEPYMTTREKGTGLGLAIVQRIMEDHHGALELDVREDGESGAVVRLTFPLAASETAAAAAE